MIKFILSCSKIFFLTIISFLFFQAYVYASSPTAKVQIRLADKNNNIIPNLKFNIYNEAGELVAEAQTNNKGIYRTKLEKGKNYRIIFEIMDREWKFNLSVPNKPGPRFYKFNFKVMIETEIQTYIKGRTQLEEKEDKSICRTKIILSDDTGMPLPLQDFKIQSMDSDFEKQSATDSNGICILQLKNGKSYDIQTVIDGYLFNTTFRIPFETIETEFNYEIDFTKIANVEIEKFELKFAEGSQDSIKTFIIVQDSAKKRLEGIEVILEESNRRVFKEITPKNGTVSTYTYREKVYELYIRKEFKTYKFEMILPRDTSIKEYTFIATVDFEFKPKRTFVLSINFDSGKWNLRKQDVPEMEKLLQQLKDNPRLVIEIGGHTDNIGSAKSNQILSEKRANTCVKYLTDRGIEPERVKGKGYGESRPIATNKTKKGRFMNRRIEVSVLNE